MVLAVTAVLLVMGRDTWAQSFPTRPVRLIVPFAPGGATDIIARLLAQRYSEQFAQQFIVENRPGGGGTAAARSIADEKPDGYNLLFATSALAINASVHKDLPYDLRRDFVPIGLIAKIPFWLLVNSRFPATNVSEMVDLAKANPGKFSYASGGTGAVTHLAAEMFKRAAGIDLVHVPYRGEAPALADVVAGQVQAIFATIPSSIELVRAGSLHALAVTTPERAPIAADVPTFSEQGYPTVQASTWFAILAPAGTDPVIVARLNAEAHKALANPEMQERFVQLGATPAAGSSDDLRSFIDAEITRWSQVVAAVGVEVQ